MWPFLAHLHAHHLAHHRLPHYSLTPWDTHDIHPDSQDPGHPRVPRFTRQAHACRFTTSTTFGYPAHWPLLPPTSSCHPPWISRLNMSRCSTRGYFRLCSSDLLDWVGALTSVVLWKSLLGCISLGVQGSPLCRMFAEDQFGKTSSRALVFTFQSTSVHTKFALVADISISDLWFR
ncbi:hypothetical protein FB45DRAFT_889376, partial [Roridomyces roridus]